MWGVAVLKLKLLSMLYRLCRSIVDKLFESVYSYFPLLLLSVAVDWYYLFL